MPGSDGILGCEEAKTRPAAAKMAVTAGMDVEAAKTSLAAMPEEKPAAATSEPEGNGQTTNTPLGSAPTPFADGMSGTGVGAEPAASAQDGGEQDQVGDILASVHGHWPELRQRPQIGVTRHNSTLNCFRSLSWQSIMTSP